MGWHPGAWRPPPTNAEAPVSSDPLREASGQPAGTEGPATLQQGNDQNLGPVMSEPTRKVTEHRKSTRGRNGGHDRRANATAARSPCCPLPVPQRSQNQEQGREPRPGPGRTAGIWANTQAPAQPQQTQQGGPTEAQGLSPGGGRRGPCRLSSSAHGNNACLSPPNTLAARPCGAQAGLRLPGAEIEGGSRLQSPEVREADK